MAIAIVIHTTILVITQAKTPYPSQFLLHKKGKPIPIIMAIPINHKLIEYENKNIRKRIFQSNNQTKNPIARSRALLKL